MNLLWEKAKKSLTDGKLERLFSVLKLQDKEELTLKRLKADMGDKDGLREAEVRKRFNGIMREYGIIQQGQQEEPVEK